MTLWQKVPPDWEALFIPIQAPLSAAVCHVIVHQVLNAQSGRIHIPGHVDVTGGVIILDDTAVLIQDLLDLVGVHPLLDILTDSAAVVDAVDGLSDLQEFGIGGTQLVLVVDVLLDEIIEGLEPGELATIGGMPKSGKTAFALHIAIEVAKEKQKSVWIYSAKH